MRYIFFYMKIIILYVTYSLRRFSRVLTIGVR